MPSKATLAVLALAALLSGCGEEDTPGNSTSTKAHHGDPDTTATADAPSQKGENLVNDWSYKAACTTVRLDKERYGSCMKDPVVRQQMAEAQASTQAGFLIEQIESYGKDVLESNLKPEIINEARSRKIEQVPVDLVGVELGVLPNLPDYFKISGGIFGYRTEVGLSAVIIGSGTEISVTLDALDEKQKEFLEMVCSPELDWKDSTCQGEIYVAVLEGSKFVELGLIGVKMPNLNYEALKAIQLRKLW